MISRNRGGWTAIAREIPVASIRVEGRLRRDMGDIDALARSIEAIGLLHPLVVDGDLRLLAGARRLEAVRRLGWDEVPARIAEERRG